MLARDLMVPTSEVVHLDQSLEDAANRLRRFGLPALPVVDGDEIVGVLTAEAVAEMAMSAAADLGETAVRDHMSAEVAFCRADESAQTAQAVMEQGGHPRLLVIDDKGELCGLLAAADAEPHGDGRRDAGESHRVTTPGRATGGPLHQPPGFSVKPVIKK